MQYRPAGSFGLDSRYDLLLLLSPAYIHADISSAYQTLTERPLEHLLKRAVAHGLPAALVWPACTPEGQGSMGICSLVSAAAGSPPGFVVESHALLQAASVISCRLLWLSLVTTAMLRRNCRYSSNCSALIIDACTHGSLYSADTSSLYELQMRSVQMSDAVGCQILSRSA